MSNTVEEHVIPAKKTGKPKWLRVKLPTGKKYTQLRGLVDKYNLHTICTSGSCPNRGDVGVRGRRASWGLAAVVRAPAGFVA